MKMNIKKNKIFKKLKKKMLIKLKLNIDFFFHIN